MTIDIELTCRTNPFSTRYIAPHAAPYLFSEGESAQRLIVRLASFGGHGQIVGPHGSGKSTLVASLLEPLAQVGRPTFVMALHDKQRRLPGDWTRQARAAEAGLIVVDGYEQLGRLARWLLKLHCRRQGWGLLVTAHVDVGLPTLATLAPNLAVAQTVVDRLLQRGENSISREIVAESFAASGGNVRETLFSLYDRYEAARVRERLPKRTCQVSRSAGYADCAGCGPPPTCADCPCAVGTLPGEDFPDFSAPCRILI